MTALISAIRAFFETPAPKPSQSSPATAAERQAEERRRAEEFRRDYSDKINKFLEEYPNVIEWRGSTPDWVSLRIKGKRPFTAFGPLVLDEEGEILRWEDSSGRFTFERLGKTLSEEERMAQIKGMLQDDEKASRYCEMIASTLLEDGACLFNAPVGIHMQESEFKERYDSESWQDAWKAALAAEFQAKDVETDPKAGIGCFRMVAI